MNTNKDPEPAADSLKIIEDGKTKLSKWLNTNFRIEMTDGRVLIGVFLCTDRDANVILGACSEYLKGSEMESEEPRVLGLVMVPGRHIVSIQIDDTTPPQKYYYGACSEYLKSSDVGSEQPRVISLAMVPGRHIVSIQRHIINPKHVPVQLFIH